MTSRFHMIAIAAVLATGAAGLNSTAAYAQAGAMQQCSVKYQAAKAAGTLGTQTWPGYLAQCRADLAAQPAAVPAPAPAVVPPKPAVAAAPPVAPKPPVAAPPAAPGSAVFPAAISAAYASEKPGKAREKTCLDQYKANKATNSNGGLNWIQKGGGYYSVCNKRLKGEA